MGPGLGLMCCSCDEHPPAHMAAAAGQRPVTGKGISRPAGCICGYVAMPAGSCVVQLLRCQSSNPAGSTACATGCSSHIGTQTLL
jgi:hypothetical protein